MVYIWGRKNMTSNACLAKIKELGIKTIHYTSDDGFCTEKLDY